MDTEKLKKKLEKKLGNFCDEANGFTETQLKDQIALAAKHLEQIRIAESEDQELNDLKEQIQEIKAPYVESGNIEKQKMQYLGILINEKSLDTPQS